MKGYQLCIFNPTRIKKKNTIPGVIIDEAIQLSKRMNVTITVFLFHELNYKKIYYKRVNERITLFAFPIVSSYGLFNLFKSYPKSLIYQFVLFLRLIKKDQPLLIRSDDTLLTGIPAKIISLIFRVRRVILIAGSNKEILSHKLSSTKTPSFLKKLLLTALDFVERFIISSATLLVISKDLTLYYSRLGGRNIIKTPTFLDLTLFSPKPKATCYKIINLLFVGRLEPEKGILDLVMAFKKLTNKYPQLHLTIVGDGSLKNKIITLIGKEKLYDKITLLGSVDHQELPQIYHNADIFVLPSYTEGLPVAMLEAMACKLPVIVTPVGQIPKVIKHNKNGFIITPGDIDSLVNSLDTLISNKNLMLQIAENGYQFVKKHYTNYIPLHVSIYKQLLMRSKTNLKQKQ